MHIKLVLTDKRVRSLKPVAKGERVYAQDKILPDLKVCITHRGPQSFGMGLRWGGRKHPAWRSLGSVWRMTTDEAREKARLWLDLHRKGIDPKREEERRLRERREKEANTFGAVAKEFFKGQADRPRSGRGRRGRGLRRKSPSRAIRALLIANEYLSAEVERLRASQSVGYVRGRRQNES